MTTARCNSARLSTSEQTVAQATPATGRQHTSGATLLVLPTLAFALLATAAPATAEQPSWHIWTVTETRRVLRDELPEDRLAVSLAAARNEWVSFQILLRSSAGVSGITVEPGDLTGPNGFLLPANEVRLYRQHQFELTQGTYRNEDFRPGCYPDGLIPFRHPLTRKPLKNARLRAVPFDLPAEQTRGFWVDIYVPSKAPPGRYRGTFHVRAGDGRVRQVPVQLTVWNFTLPEVPTLQTAFGSPAARMRQYYRQRAKQGKEPEPTNWAEIDRQCADLLARHRVNATPPPGSLTPVRQPDGTVRIPDEQIVQLREFVDRYHINALQVPHPHSVVKDPVAEQDKLRAWLAAWDDAFERLNRPYVVPYIYLRDEPNDQEAYEYVRRWGRAIRATGTKVKVLVVEQTTPQNDKWGDLYGAVDIWCALFPLFDAQSAARRQALGETIWAYTALCQRDMTPWWHTDYPLLHYRVPAWICWRYRIRGLLYWGGMSYWYQVDDPWTDPKTYVRSRGNRTIVYNGEGSLVYPGRAVGYEGIAPSLRLKALRDSIEDYEFLALLERMGRASQAEEVIGPLVESFFQWNKDPVAYELARRKLAELIVASGQ